MSAPSLMRRVAVRLTLLTVAAAAILYGLLYAEYLDSRETLRDSSLQSQLRDLLSHLQPGPRLTLPDSVAATYAAPGGRFRYALSVSGGARVAASPAPVWDWRNVADADGRPEYYSYVDAGHRVYGAVQRIELAGRPVWVQVEQDESHDDLLVEHVLAEFWDDGGGWFVLPFLAAMLGSSLLTIQRTLAPLRRVSALARRIGPGNTELRLPATGMPRELLPVVEAVNGALERLDGGFRMQREFTADAAHQLRTPLAVLRSHVDTLADRDTSAALRRDLDVMARLVEQLLKVAQLEAVAIAPDQRADLRDVALDVAALLGPWAIEAGKTIEVDDGPAVPVRGNRDILYNVVRNLAENALVHTGPGTAVVITPRADGSLAVRDHGPGVPPERRELVFKRFWRGDRRDNGGAGLGLAIVARAMELHGGGVAIEDAPGGGAVFILKFPPLAPDGDQPSGSRQ